MVSERVARAEARAQQRRDGHTARLRPLGWLLLAGVAISSWTSAYPPGLSGRRLVVSLVLLWYAVAMSVVGTGHPPRLAPRTRLVLAVLACVPAVLLTALEPYGTLNVLPVSGVVMTCFIRLEPRPALIIGGSTTLALAVVMALTADFPLEAASAAVLLCVVLAVTAQLLRTSRASHDRTELLLAELEDAREAETRAAAGAERARIARELHDVLAQSLSALAIQLEGARKIAERDQAGPLLQQIIGRSVELTREGLDEARQAVGALRGDRLPDLADLASLVERSGRDLRLDVALEVRGAERVCESQAGFALYRGVQEALTNVARYASGSRAEVALEYRPDRVVLTVANTAGTLAAEASGGGGNGLRGMRERIERVGGAAGAGPTPSGWLVTMEVPA
ncbi:histidine kinase [Kitasatospora sp. NBC_01287]|uniref:sensor histidine kinase n=1 Tax=Kitasatospora sp. NBC_01287 TaxID=2903573 RepID=UPI00225576B5|nr:histidine kinase [Kitasatospora sp. NBC_01287]MCX4748174.1 histidine kinase [Kitasatospora sp. NBC_01287]